MSFSVVPTPPASGETPIETTFWPDIDPVKLRAEQRIDGGIAAERLRAALIEAIASVDAELAAWRAGHQAAGVAALADLDAGEIDGESIMVHRYRRAVGCLAKADLLERHRDIDGTARADRKAEALSDPIDDLRRDARWALSDLCGRSRSTVELI